MAYVLPQYLQSQYQNDPRLAMAQALQQQGMSAAPIQSWAQGLARVAQGVVGGYNQSRLRDEYQQQGQQYSTDLAKALGAQDPVSALSQSQNPELQQMGLQYQLQRATRAPLEKFTTLTSDQAKNLGLPAGGTYQQNTAGQVSAISQPQQSPAEIQEYDAAVKEGFKGDFLSYKRAVAQAGQQPHEMWSPVYGPDGKTQIGQKSSFGKFEPINQGNSFGAGDTGKALDILTNGNPTSPVYKSAYWLMSQPKITVDQNTGQMTTVTPDMRSFRQPAGGQPAPGAAQPAVPQLPGGPAPAQPPSMQPQGNIIPGQPLPAPQAPPAVPGAPGVSITQVANPAPKPLSEDQAKNMQLYSRAANQLPIVEKNFDALGSFSDRAAGATPDAIRGFIQSPAYQQGDNALNDIAATYLYSVSGATANPGEVKNLAKTVTPIPGEPKASRDQKLSRLHDMVNSIKMRTQGGAQSDLPQQQLVPTTDYMSKYGLQGPQ